MYVAEDVESVHDINQEGIPTCTANAVAFAIAVQLMLDPTDIDPFFPSRLYLHLVACKVSYNRPSISAMMRGIERYGIIAEGDWVYNVAQYPAGFTPKTTLPYRVQCERILPDVANVKRAVLGRRCVLAGLAVYANFLPQDKIVPVPQKDYKCHTTVAIYGFDDHEQAFIAKGTYGVECGEKGSFLIPYIFLVKTAPVYGQQRPVLGDLFTICVKNQ
jgi:hypothetical protein